MNAFLLKQRLDTMFHMWRNPRHPEIRRTRVSQQWTIVLWPYYTYSERVLGEESSVHEKYCWWYYYSVFFFFKLGLEIVYKGTKSWEVQRKKEKSQLSFFFFFFDDDLKTCIYHSVNDWGIDFQWDSFRLGVISIKILGSITFSPFCFCTWELEQK